MRARSSGPAAETRLTVVSMRCSARETKRERERERRAHRIRSPTSLETPACGTDFRLRVAHASHADAHADVSHGRVGLVRRAAAALCAELTPARARSRRTWREGTLALTSWRRLWRRWGRMGVCQLRRSFYLDAKKKKTNKQTKGNCAFFFTLTVIPTLRHLTHAITSLSPPGDTSSAYGSQALGSRE